MPACIATFALAPVWPPAEVRAAANSGSALAAVIATVSILIASITDAPGISFCVIAPSWRLPCGMVYFRVWLGSSSM
ncbi:MAG: hypothetical protein R3F13_08625 [Prosthecobacter sp.]